MIRLSLNEIEATVKKAAQAAGVPHGLAGEAGRGSAWLAGRELPGIEACVAALRRVEDAAPENPKNISFERRGNDLLAPGDVSALWLGPAAVDHLLTAQAQKKPCRVAADSVDEALLCLACAAIAAEEHGVCLTLTWGAGGGAGDVIRAQCHQAGVQIEGDLRARTPGPLVMELELAGDAGTRAADRKTPSDLTDRLRQTLDRGVAVAPDLWESVGVLAARMLVPATDASRLTGAGAGLTDND